MEYGLQLFSVRDMTGADLEGALKAIEELGVPEAQEFIKDFLPSYRLTLDELIY